MITKNLTDWTIIHLVAGPTPTVAIVLLCGGENYNRSPTHWLQTNSCLLCPPLNIFPVPRWSSSFMMLLTPALLCHKDTAQGTQGPLVQGICHMRPNAVKTQRKAGNAALWLFFYKSPESLARPYKCSMFPPWFCLNSDDNGALGTCHGKRIYRLHWLQRFYCHLNSR